MCEEGKGGGGGTRGKRMCYVSYTMPILRIVYINHSCAICIDNVFFLYYEQWR